MNDHSPAYASPTERVKTWLDGAALHVRFNNPARHNALSVDMWEAVPPLLAQAEADDAVRLVVFSGEGTKSFVSGADISQFDKMRSDADAQREYSKQTAGGRLRLATFPKPVKIGVRAVGWVESEVEAYLAARVANSRKAA